jgi:alkylated DNA repair dioxygenase AlkB
MEVDPWLYKTNVMTKQESKEYFSQLKPIVKKEKDEMMIYGRKVQEPRFKNFFSRDGHGYNYSSTKNESAGWPAVIEKLAVLAKELVGCEQDFDSALVNYYPDGEHYVSPHTDKDAMEGYIASFSFGATRTFHIRRKNGGTIYKKQDLHDGSLFIMKPGMQQAFTHGLPKMANVGPRYNVTFRQHQKLKKDGDSRVTMSTETNKTDSMNLKRKPVSEPDGSLPSSIKSSKLL